MCLIQYFIWYIYQGWHCALAENILLGQRFSENGKSHGKYCGLYQMGNGKVQ